MAPRLACCLAALALAACSAPTTRADDHATNENAATTPFEPPSWAAPLFEQDHAWSYTLETRSSHWDDTHPDADPQGNVETVATATATCNVDEVVELTAARASYVSCEGDLPVGGYWLANPDGLFVLSALPASDAELAALIAEATLVLPAQPVDVERSEEDAEGFGESYTVDGSGTGWCVAFGSWGGDEAGSSLCFEPELGPVSGSDWWAGGSTHETTFELAP